MMRANAVHLVLLLTCLARPAWADRDERDRQADRVFQMDRMLTIRIHMTGEQWKMMQPEKASRLAVALGVVQHPTTQQTLEAAGVLSPPDKKKSDPPAEGERRLPGLTGNEYAYVAAGVEIDGQRMTKVGVRFKGQYSYTLSGTSPRRPMKLKFDHFVDEQRFEGIEALSLNSNALDPSHLRESLGFACFRDAGVPAPRTCFAMVYLTVDGVYDNEMLGLYSVLEEVDKDFLRRHFDTPKGLLIRPERTRNLAYLGDRWDEYRRYNLQTDATPFTAGRFMGFTRLIHHGSEEEFATAIGTYVDPDAFARFIAANVLMVNLDSVLVNGHNFYAYIHPKSGKVNFIPWDLHLGFGWHGRTLEDWTGLTIDRPYRDMNRLLDRAMVVGAIRDSYRGYLREFATGCFSPQKMHPRIERLEEVVTRAEAIAWAAGKELPVSMPTQPQPRAELKAFVTARVQSVLDQLDGKIEGDPVGGRPPPPKPRPVPVPKPVAPPRPAVAATRPALVPPHSHKGISKREAREAAATRPSTRPVAPPLPPPKVVKAPIVPPKPREVPPSALAQTLLRNLDADRDSQFNRDEVVDAARHLFIAHYYSPKPGPIVETSLADTLDRVGVLVNPYPTPVDDQATPEDPARARPALSWARAIVNRADPDKAGEATLDGLIVAAGKAFDEADADRNGVLTLREISAWMDQVVPR